MNRKYLYLTIRTLILAAAAGLTGVACGGVFHNAIAQTNRVSSEAKAINDAAYALIQQGEYGGAIQKSQEAIRLDLKPV